MQGTLKPQTTLSPQKRRLLAMLLEKKGVAVASKPETRTIARRKARQSIPLALNQEGLWFIDRMDPGKANYNVPGTVRLRGRLDVDALEKSLGEIVRRHEALRTTLVVNGTGQPVQHIAPAEKIKLEAIDLWALPEVEREAEAKRIATEAAQYVFDLAKGPLYRFLLARLGEEDFMLCANFHHSIADGWAMGVFSNELRALYAAFSNGKPSPLPELPVQFGDFAIWQREQVQSERMAKELAWWRDKLRGKLPFLELPTDHPRPKTQSFRGKHQSIHLAKSLSDAIRRFARREGVSVFMALLAGFKALLYSYSKQKDIIVGSTFANRSARELENLIGFFVNTLPMRTNLSGDPDFCEVLKRVRETI
ncbi:MAG: condensation domain-containing protein, partial [bacterium]